MHYLHSAVGLVQYEMPGLFFFYLIPNLQILEFNIVQAFFQQFWEKATGQNLEKMIDLTSKLGEINDIEHNKGSKIYPQNHYFRLLYVKHTTFAQMFKYHFEMDHYFSQ